MVDGSETGAVSAEASRTVAFLSYSRSNMRIADEIARALAFDEAFDVLIDRQDIHEGEA